MKFANKYKLVSASDQRAPPAVPLLPQETGLRNYERAASALADNIRDRSIPSDVALENHAFLRDNYMEALNRVMSDRNQIVDRLDSIARLISLNAPAGGVPAPLAGIRDVREPEEPVKHERTLQRAFVLNCLRSKSVLRDYPERVGDNCWQPPPPKPARV